MIFAVTSGDDATSSNHAVCLPLNDGSQAHLFGPHAIRQNLLALLTGNPEADVFLVGHGSSHAFIGSDGVAAACIDDAGHFVGRKCFAIACRTGERFGAVVSESGGTWCGYVGAIGCLQSEPDVIDIFREIPIFVMRRLHTVIDERTARLFINDFEGLIQTIEDFLDINRVDSMAAYHALQYFRDRLRVWLPASEEPLYSDRATWPPLF